MEKSDVPTTSTPLRVIFTIAAVAGLSVAVVNLECFLSIRATLSHPSLWNGMAFGFMAVSFLLRAVTSDPKSNSRLRIVVASLALICFAGSIFFSIQTLNRSKELQACDSVLDDPRNRETADRLLGLRTVLKQYADNHGGQYPLDLTGEFKAFLNGKEGSGPQVNPYSGKIDQPVLGSLKSLNDVDENFKQTGEPGQIEYSPINHGASYVLRAFGKNGRLLVEPSGDYRIYNVVSANADFPKLTTVKVSGVPVSIPLRSGSESGVIPRAVAGVFASGSQGLVGKAQSLFQKGDYTNARKSAIEALRTIKQKDPHSKEILSAIYQIGMSYQAEKKFSEQVAFLQAEMDAAKLHGAPDDVIAALSLQLVTAYASAREDEAMVHFAQDFRSTTTFEKLPQPSKESVLQQLAFSYSRLSKHKDSAQIWKQLAEQNSNSIGRAGFLEKYALELFRDGKLAEAEKFCAEALQIEEQTFGPKHMTLVFTLHTLAKIYMAESQFAKAEECYRRALSIEEEVQGPNAPIIAGTLYDLSALLTQRDPSSEEARKLSERARRIRDASGGRGGSKRRS